DTSVGAPPDKFNTQGQDWSTPPFDPWALREGGYEPFIQTLRATMRASRGLRIDHVMGLARLYCIPKGSSAAQGAYVRYPVDDLMAIVALESRRARAFVVGEDLGTVEGSLRAKMTDQQMLSYRLVIFSGFSASRYPRMTFAAVSTHDLPTIAGLWSGSDLLEQSERGLSPNGPATAAMISSIRKGLKIRRGLKLREASVELVADRIHSWLAERDSSVAVVSLEDLLGEPSRVNMPSTHLKRPNWSMALSSTLEDLTEDPRARRLSDQMRNRRGPMPR
ncbi:MAG TPA: 4-alpha-glucanotransferase, partial [Actinomycetota bacterium]|nr:4-alpha-glucanotransferase [Actinomycetota bacterium]